MLLRIGRHVLNTDQVRWVSFSGGEADACAVVYFRHGDSDNRLVLKGADAELLDVALRGEPMPLCKATGQPLYRQAEDAWPEKGAGVLSPVAVEVPTGTGAGNASMRGA